MRITIALTCLLALEVALAAGLIGPGGMLGGVLRGLLERVRAGGGAINDQTTA